jgi:hypothetical protein
VFAAVGAVIAFFGMSRSRAAAAVSGALPVEGAQVG